MNFSIWYEYFRANQDHFAQIDWKENASLTLDEKSTITSSIRQFQRGEHSEGKHFLQYAKSMKDQSYIQALQLFIKEEQDHAAVLGKFMDIHGIEKLKKDWLDNTFRWLRKLAGLECTITVLLTAEIIAMVYYKALDSATSSNLLQQICRQIVIDEEMHLRFQTFALHILYHRKSKFSVFLSRIFHKVLMFGTIVLVWIYHAKVLNAGSYKFFSFFRSVFNEFKRCERMIKQEHLNLPVRKSVIHAA